jgi:DNA end-binding protein Ku
MAARAMWKGVIRFGEVRIPVKLFAALQERSVHFRLLHAADHAPVRQVLINPDSGQGVAYKDARRGYVTAEGEMVILNDKELAALEPQRSRDIDVLQFVPPRLIDHRWYQRPYYLGPDEGAMEMWSALIGALAEAEAEGLARWVMRGKEYVGALRLHAGRPLLISLRHVEQIVSLEDLETPAGPPLDKRELGMARQLIDMLADDFNAADYHDAYRERVQEFIDAKARGRKLRVVPARRRPPSEDLSAALQASLRQERKRA